MRDITGIMACDQHYVLSYKGKLPWYCPEDLAFYKGKIKNQIVIMGYTTYQQMDLSFFQNHHVIVFSKKVRNEDNPFVRFVSSLDAFYDLKNLPEEKQCYLIGGGELVAFFLKHKALAHFYLTEIEGYYPGDVFFPMELLINSPRSVYLEGSCFRIYYYTNLSRPSLM